MKALFSKAADIAHNAYSAVYPLLCKIGKSAAGAAKSAISALKDLLKSEKLSWCFGGTGAFINMMKSDKKQITKVLMRALPALLVAVMLIFPLFNRVTLAYEVKCDGETIGFVSDGSVLDEASDIVINKAIVEEELPTEPQLTPTIVSQDMLCDADDLSEKIIESEDQLVSGCGVFVEGEFIFAVSDKGAVEQAIEQIKNDYIKSTKADKAEIIEDVSYDDGLFRPLQFIDEETIKSRLCEGVLSVRTIITEKVSETIEYSSQTVKDSTKYTGYKSVTVKGSNGERVKTYESTYVNGTLVGKKLISDKVTKQAVNEQITVGTKQASDGTSSNKYVWPVAKGAGSYVSQYFGHYGHTGIDIAAYQGTQIYAAQSGTVIEVVYGSTGYGRRFKIKGADGTVNLYAHCSEINVSVGDVVQAGDPIAKVGQTGNATGPHLHFEVIRNGVQVSPSPYLGLS